MGRYVRAGREIASDIQRRADTGVSALELEEIAAGVLVLGGVGAYWIAAIAGAARHARALREEHVHATRAHYAAVEAALDNPSYSPDAIEQTVAEVVALANGLWRKGTIRSSRGRIDEPVIRAWAKSCQFELGKGLEAVGRPAIDLLNVINRDDEEEDRFVVRVRLRIRCKHPSFGTLPGGLGAHHTHLDERWTFGRSEDNWILLSVDGDPLAGPILKAPLVSTPSSDTERLREESLAELASAQKVGAEVALEDLVSADEPPALALLDLSIIDPRFLPALIAEELAHLLESWEAAVTGSEGPLEELASVKARTALLRPRHGTRMIVRDAVLKSWETTRLDLARDLPAVEVTLNVEAIRYVVSDNGTALAGSDTVVHEMELMWMLELTDSPQVPWHLVASNIPAEAIHGWDGFNPSASGPH